MRFLFLLIPFLLHAMMLEVGDAVILKEISSQHAKKHRLIGDGMWVVTWDKESTHIANEYFKLHGMKPHEQLLVDVSQVPSGIMTLFVLPKMRRYEHEILLCEDEAYNLTLPYKEGSLTLLHVENARVKEIFYPKTSKELEELLK